MKKMRIHSRIFLPVLLLLLLLPLATWFVFGITVRDYMHNFARDELKNLLKLMRPVADEVFQEPPDAASMTSEQRKQLELEQSKMFLNRMRTLLKNNIGNAQMLLLSYNLEAVYPKSLEENPDAQALYNYYRQQLSNMPRQLEKEVIRQLTLESGVYLTHFQELESNAKVRVKYMISYSPVDEAGTLLNGVGLLVLLITASLAALSLAAMWMVASRISGPIRTLCGYAKRIGSGDFRPIEEKSSLREISELNGAMNEMARQLAQADAAQKNFFQNASHELRTPLMSISGYAQGIQFGVFDDNTQAAETIVTESVRLTELVEGILTLTRLDNAKQSLQRFPIHLEDFMQDYLKRLEGLALGRNIRLSIQDITDDLYVEADEELLGKAFTNVAANCIRYAAARVEIRAQSRGERVMITVSDDGPGFSPEDIAHLFERFYKGKGGNFGIGLAIAKSSMEYMGGEIKAHNSPEGAVFELIL